VFRPALFLVLLAVGSSRLAAEPPPTPVLPKNTFGLPAEIDPRKISFDAPVVGEKFLALDAAARKLAGADWAKRTGDRYPYTSWNSGSDGYNQTYAGNWEKAANPKPGVPARPNHSIRLGVTLYAGSPSSAHGFSFSATSTPKTGWGAGVSFSTHERKDRFFESFWLILRHDELTPRRTNTEFYGLSLGPGQCQFSTSRTDAKYVYNFHVTSRPAGDNGLNQKPLGREIARYWASADSFREVALEELDRLESNAKDGIASGKVVTITTKGGPTGADVPMPVAPGSVTTPEAVKAAVLKEALAEIEGRKKLVRGHFKEMHAATVAAFPGLGEILTPPAKK
jgi:hypothetical protein